MCGRFTVAELVSFSLSVTIVCIWVLTGHWLLMDAMGMGLCVAFIAFVRLPSLKVSTLLLTGLLIYDVFWVFFSSYIFSSNVMVKVATRPADNPVGIVAKKLNLSGVREPPKLSLPGKLIFPSMQNNGHFSMLGLGDIVSKCCSHFISLNSCTCNIRLFLQVMPGLLLCFVLRYDAYKRAQLNSAEAGVPPPNHLNKITYFHCSLIGYFFGIVELCNNKGIHFSSSFRSVDCYSFIRSFQSCSTSTLVFSSFYFTSPFDYGLHKGILSKYLPKY